MTVLEFLSKTVAHFQIDSTKNRGIPQRRPAGARNLQKPAPSLVDGLDPEVRHCGGMSVGHSLNVWRSQRCWVTFTNPCKHVETNALCTLRTARSRQNMSQDHSARPQQRRSFAVMLKSPSYYSLGSPNITASCLTLASFARFNKVCEEHL